MSRSYVAFISYKHARRDSAIAKEVHTLIENYVIPPALRKGSRKLGIVFRDEEELPISSDLSESIQTALRATQYLILICSPEASASPWVAREVDYFLQHHDASRIFVVLAAGEPGEVFPAAITRVLNPATGEYQDVEPLALDVRANSLHASLKILRERIRKLYAAMLGCSYDSLVQREKVRRMKRIMALAALMVVVAGCFAGVILSKNLELSKKNKELYEVTQNALERESLLLAADADEALQNNDALSALRYAADALDSSAIERPFCAAAERVLYSALNIFSDDTTPFLLTHTPLTQHSPIESAVYSADGKQVYTIDAYGAVICFNASTGEVLWNRTLPENNKNFYAVVPAIWFDEKNSLLVCSFDGSLSGLHADSGETVWLSELTAEICQGPFFDSNRQSLVYLEAVSVYDDQGLETAVEVQLVTLETSDGSRRREVPIFTNTSDCYIETIGSTLKHTGAFTDSGRFVALLRSYQYDEWKTLLYWVDVGADKPTIIEHKVHTDILDLYTAYHLACLDNNQVLILNTGSAIHARCYNMAGSRLVWETETPFHAGFRFFIDCDPVILPRTSDVLIGYGNVMYLISKTDGSLRTSKLLDDKVVGIWPLQPGLFGYALADGYTAVGWFSAGAIRDSVFYCDPVDLPDLTTIIPYNRGLLHARLSGSNIAGISPVPLQEGGGSVLYLSADRLTAWVAAVRPAAKLPPYTVLPSPDGVDLSFAEFADSNLSGTVLLTPSVGAHLLIADVSGRTLHKIPLNENLSTTSQYLLTKDGQSVINVNRFGQIRHIAPDGAITVLSEAEDVSLGVIGNTEYFGSRYHAAAARLRDDGRVLTVRLDGEEIVTWLDEEESVVIPRPDNIRWSVQQGLMPHCLLRVGPSGILVLSHYASEGASAIDSFAVYHPARKEWQLIPDAAHGTDARLIAFSSEQDAFAVYDEDMVIRIYDCARPERVRCINAALSAESVIKICFLPGDEYIYAATEDGQFVLFDVETGGIVFRTISSAYSASNYATWLDNANSRLYIRMGKTGVCVDTRSWEQLYTLDNFSKFLFYSEATNEVCISHMLDITQPHQMVLIQALTTEELVRIARDTLE